MRETCRWVREPEGKTGTKAERQERQREKAELAGHEHGQIGIGQRDRAVDVIGTLRALEDREGLLIARERAVEVVLRGREVADIAIQVAERRMMRAFPSGRRRGRRARPEW